MTPSGVEDPEECLLFRAARILLLLFKHLAGCPTYMTVRFKTSANAETIHKHSSVTRTRTRTRQV